MSNNVTSGLNYKSTEHWVADEPDEQVEEREALDADISQAGDVIKGIFDRLDEQIAFFESIDSIPDAISLDADAIRITMQANKKTVDALREERKALSIIVQEGLRET